MKRDEGQQERFKQNVRVLKDRNVPVQMIDVSCGGFVGSILKVWQCRVLSRTAQEKGR
jgi:hypothetical protein